MERFKAATAELATIEERATTDAEGAKRLALVRKAEQVTLSAQVVSAVSSHENFGRVEGSL